MSRLCPPFTALLLTACAAGTGTSAAPEPSQVPEPTFTASQPSGTPQVRLPPTPTLAPTATPTPSPFLSPTVMPSPGGPTAAATSTHTPFPTRTATPSILPDGALGGRWVLRQVRMFRSGEGWGLASDAAERSIALLRTIDSGLSWTQVSPRTIDTLPGAFPGPVSTVILDQDRAWLVIVPGLACEWYGTDCPLQLDDARSELLYTQDGGRTWDGRTLPYPGLFPYFSVNFVDDLNGWILQTYYAGAGSSMFDFVRTRDGGRSWEELMKTDHGLHEYTVAVSFTDAHTGLMTFPQQRDYFPPYIRWTYDGGDTWQDTVNLPAPPDNPALFDLSRDDPPFCGTYFGRLFSPQAARLVVICNESPASRAPLVASLLYATSDGGASWQVHPYPAGTLQFIDPLVGWSLGELIHQTLDGGVTWQELGGVPWQGHFSFADARHGWAVGETQTAAGRVIRLYRTQDGGRTWNELSPRLRP